MMFTAQSFNSKAKAPRGFTLAELTIAMVLMSFVVFLAGSLINLAARGFVGSEIKQGIVQEDTAFAAKLTESIQKSTVGFTVPYQSFNNINKLTAGWNYLGLMENVHIPAAVSRTGREIASAQALVYIEYYGDSAPGSIPLDCNLIHNSEGYFIQKVLGHAFTDNYGMKYTYSLEFKPTNPQNTAAQSIIYKFSSLVNGEDATNGGSKEMDIDSMLSCLNAIQVVYKGSDTNPAVALAFRGDFLPTWSAQQASSVSPAATIVMVLDLSASMDNRISNTDRRTRISALKESACEFVDQFSANENINIILIPFSNVAYLKSLFSGNRLPSKKVFNAKDDCQLLRNTINGMKTLNMTNAGDGLRVAHIFLNELKRNTSVDMGQVFLILMTDGIINSATKYQGRIYYGDRVMTDSSAYTGVSSTGRAYTEYWANQIVSTFGTHNYLISISNGMGSQDREMLERVFGTDVMDVNSVTDFQTVWEDIGSNIEEVMWAFEGPNL